VRRHGNVTEILPRYSISKNVRIFVWNRKGRYARLFTRGRKTERTRNRMTNFLGGVYTRTWLALQCRRLRRRDLIYAVRGYRHLSWEVFWWGGGGGGGLSSLSARLRTTFVIYTFIRVYVFVGHLTKTVAGKLSCSSRVTFAGSIDATTTTTTSNFVYQIKRRKMPTEFWSVKKKKNRRKKSSFTRNPLGHIFSSSRIIPIHWHGLLYSLR